jgi:hypothetical protein
LFATSSATVTPAPSKLIVVLVAISSYFLS